MSKQKAKKKEKPANNNNYKFIRVYAQFFNLNAKRLNDLLEFAKAKEAPADAVYYSVADREWKCLSKHFFAPSLMEALKEAK